MFSLQIPPQAYVNEHLDTQDGNFIKDSSHSVVSFFFFSTVDQHQLVLLLAAAMATAVDSLHNLASERSSIQSTYELTKYLEYQLKEIKDVYVSSFVMLFSRSSKSLYQRNKNISTVLWKYTRINVHT